MSDYSTIMSSIIWFSNIHADTACTGVEQIINTINQQELSDHKDKGRKRL